MSSSAFGPQQSSKRVSEDERDRVVDFLQEAYAAGKLSPGDFEVRMGWALAAKTRGELSPAFDGIPHTKQAKAPVVPPGELSAQDRVAATLTHASGAVSVFVGPAIVYGATDPGPVHDEARKALRFQLVMFTLGAIGVVVTMILPALWWVIVLEVLAGISLVGFWLVGTGAAALRTMSGKKARYPLVAGPEPRQRRSLGR